MNGGRDAVAPIDGWRIAPYALPLRRPWVDARGRLDERRGWLVALRAGDRFGFGECAPLESAGTENAAEAAPALEALVRGVSGRLPEDGIGALPPAPGPAPAARCAVETALLDLRAQVLGLPMAACLAPGPVATLAVNGVLGPARTAVEHLSEALVAGYRVLKVKVGGDPWEQEREALAALSAAVPSGVSLRLDANGAWSVHEAAIRIRELARWPVEALEEPSAEATDADLAQLQALSPFPLALDESLTSRPAGRIPVRRQVLKPMVTGGPLAVVERAAATESETVVTTTVDGAIGSWAAVHAAAAVAGLSRIPERAGLAHGLGTSGWLARDVAEPPDVVEGRIHVPAVPGLGVRPRMFR